MQILRIFVMRYVNPIDIDNPSKARCTVFQGAPFKPLRVMMTSIAGTTIDNINNK
jgi:hypothetical protein